MQTDLDAWNEAAASKPLNMAEMDQLVRDNQALWADYDAKKKIASEAYEKADASDAKIMEALTNAGKSKYHVDGVGTTYLVLKSVVRVPGTIEEKQRFFQYLRETAGDEFFYSMATVNSNSLNSWYAKKTDEAGEKGILDFSVPGISEPTMRRTLNFRKGK